MQLDNFGIAAAMQAGTSRNVFAQEKKSALKGMEQTGAACHVQPRSVPNVLDVLDGRHRLPSHAVRPARAPSRCRWL
eukprot:6160206-Pleurochrysis_carterae.AAC.1